MKVDKWVIMAMACLVLCGCHAELVGDFEETANESPAVCYSETSKALEVIKDTEVNEESKNINAIQEQICWKTIMGYLPCNFIEIGSLGELEIYLKGPVSDHSEGGTNVVISRVGNRVDNIELSNGYPNKEYGRCVWRSAEMDNIHYDYYADLIKDAREEHQMAIKGNVSSELSEGLNRLLAEKHIRDIDLENLFIICVQIICEEYLKHNDEIYGKLNAELHLEQVNITADGVTMLTGEGYFCYQGNDPVKIKIEYKVRPWVELPGEHRFQIELGETEKKTEFDNAFMVRCDIITE